MKEGKRFSKVTNIDWCSLLSAPELMGLWDQTPVRVTASVL